MFYHFYEANCIVAQEYQQFLFYQKMMPTIPCNTSYFINISSQSSKVEKEQSAHALHGKPREQYNGLEILKHHLLYQCLESKIRLNFQKTKSESLYLNIQKLQKFTENLSEANRYLKKTRKEIQLKGIQCTFTPQYTRTQSKLEYLRTKLEQVQTKVASMEEHAKIAREKKRTKEKMLEKITMDNIKIQKEYTQKIDLHSQLQLKFIREQLNVNELNFNKITQEKNLSCEKSQIMQKQLQLKAKKIHQNLMLKKIMLREKQIVQKKLLVQKQMVSLEEEQEIYFKQIEQSLALKQKYHDLQNQFRELKKIKKQFETNFNFLNKYQTKNHKQRRNFKPLYQNS